MYSTLHIPYISTLDMFFFLSEQIWRNLALYHLITNGFSAVNGGAVRMRVQTADNKIIII